MNENPELKIDIDGVLKSRLPRYYRFIPSAMVRWLEKVIRQEDLNRLLAQNAGLEGAEFARGILNSLEINVNLKDASLLPDKDDRRVLYVSNHPLGGLDGMALIALLQAHHGGKIWFVVNDLLMAVKPLHDVFLPINKFGKQSRVSFANIERAFASSDPIIMFPAGMVSRLQTINTVEGPQRTVCDLRWRKTFITRAIQSQRDVIPLHFSGANSMDFYRKANLRKSLGLKFNLEMVLLPREMMLNRGATFTVSVGERKHWQALSIGEAQGFADAICAEIYEMGKS